MSEPVICSWCERPASRWCDAVIGLEATGCVRKKDGSVDHLLTGSRGKGGGMRHWTCDSPLCFEHAKQVGHICGKEPDSIDRCPYHQQNAEHGMKSLIIFDHEAEEFRSKLRVAIRRWRMKDHKATAP